MDEYRLYAVDWSHTEEKLAVYDGKKTSMGKMPETGEDVMIVTENMPQKYAKPFIEGGGKIMRCSPNASAGLREEVQKKNPDWEKTDENDVKLIWMLYKKKPDLFRQMKLDPPLAVYYKIFKDYQEVRIRTGNRLYADMSGEMDKFFKQVEKGEAELKRVIENELPKHPIYDKWLSKIKGIGPSLAGGLICLIGDISRFDSISKLWAYSGYKVDDGKVQKRTKGQTSNWKNDIRTLCRLVVDVMAIKHRSEPYRGIYDKEKARQLEKVPKLHAHNRAIRKVAKIFLQHYWCVARELAGLTVSQPWIIAHGEHVDLIKPPHWKV